MANETVTIILLPNAPQALGTPTGYVNKTRFIMGPITPGSNYIPTLNQPIVQDAGFANNLRSPAGMDLKVGEPFQMSKEVFNALPLGAFRKPLADMMTRGFIGVGCQTGTTGYATMLPANVIIGIS